MSTKRKKLDKEAIRRKKALTTTLYLPADEVQAEAYEQAKQARGLAVFGGDEAQIEKATAALKAVEETIEEEGTVFYFKGVGRKRFDALLTEHLPTEAQVKEEYTFNADTFWPALFAETIDSDLTAEDWVTEVIDSPEWGGAEVKLLRDAAQHVNTMTRVADLGN